MQRLIESISLFILIGVTVLRPLVAESYDSAGSPLTAALDGMRDPSPVVTLIFDLLILVGTLGWLIGRAAGRVRPFRPTGLELGAILVLVAAVVSCLVAGNQRLAINASIDWLCYPILAIALTQLLHRADHRRIFLAAILASAFVQAAQCYDQYFFTFDQTIAHYETIKADYWASQGVDLESSKVEAFERRMLAREATGSLPHSNVTGSYLVLCGIVALAVLVANWGRRGLPRDRSVLVVSGALAATILGATFLTGSLGAFLSGLAAMALWLGLWVFRSWVGNHRSKALILGWTAVVAGILATTGHGIYHGKLPTWSLTFRWWYWDASADLIADHALTGVGRENFGRHYLQYKAITSPEEVANPHNLFVQAAADWGVAGLVGVLLMLVGVSIKLATRAGASEESSLTDASERGPPLARALSRRTGEETRTVNNLAGPLAWAVGLLLVVTWGRRPLLGTDDADFLYVTTALTGTLWLVGFSTSLWVLPATSGRNGRAGAILRAGSCVALFSFVVHDMINFAAFVPGTATTLFAMLALCVASGSQRIASSTESTGHTSMAYRWLPVGAALAILAIVLHFGAVPVSEARHSLTRAEQSGRRILPTRIDTQLADRFYREAVDADPLDPTAPVHRAAWLLTAANVPALRVEALHLASRSLDEAIRRDPVSVELQRMRMQLLMRDVALTGDPTARLAAIEAARRALALYPRDPHGLKALADRLGEAGEAGDDQDLLREAINTYERALAMDDARIEWEELRRFRPKQRKAILSKIEAARRMLPPAP